MRQNGFGHDMKGDSSPAAGKEAVDVSVDAYGYIWRNIATNVPRVVVEVRLTNKAGHAIPAGPPSNRHLVLETVATGSDDNVVLFTGRRGYRVGHQRLGRGKQEATGPHDSSGIVGSSALPPEKTVRERFDFLLPSEDSLGRKVSIRVRLLEVGRGSSSESTTRYEFKRDLVVGGAR